MRCAVAIKGRGLRLINRIKSVPHSVFMRINPMKVIIVGGGGYANVVADMLITWSKFADYDILGYVDSPTIEKKAISLPYLGDFSACGQLKPDSLVMAVDDVDQRRTAVVTLGKGWHWLSVNHPSAVLGDRVSLGTGTIVGANAVIEPDVIIGNFVVIGSGATIGYGSVIKDFSHISAGQHIPHDATVES